MKNFFSVAVFFLFSGLSFSQNTNQDPIQLIHEKLMRSKSTPSNKESSSFVSGLIGKGNKAPLGVFAKSLGDQKLKEICTFFSVDSLNGFNFEKKSSEIFTSGIKLLSEYRAAMYRAQVAFVKQKFNIVGSLRNEIVTPSTKLKLDPISSINSSICNNIDFEDGNFGGWTVASGINSNSNSPLTLLGPGFFSTDQNIYSCSDVNLITSAYGVDPLGIAGLDPNGGTTSVRVGGFSINTSDGYNFGCSGAYWTYLSNSNGEKLEKTITVTAANALLSYDYAVVLNDGGHADGEQPYFHVYVTDLAGTVLSSCTQYYVQAPAGSAPVGFSNSGLVNTYDNSVLYYKNWTSNSINLTPYIGQTVNISFVAAGCTYGAHPGYAYVDAICGPLDIDISNSTPCPGSNVILTAPSVQGGSYLWSGTGVNGLTTQTANITSSGTYSCIITPPQGALCAYTVTRTVTYGSSPSANAGPTQSITCANTSTVLSGSGGVTYNWSGPGIVSGGATANPTVNVSGTYSLVITDPSGCLSSPATVSVALNNTTSVPNVSTSGTITCLSSSISLSSLATGVTYTWVAPTGASISGNPNNANTTANGAGTYTLNITNIANGCNNSSIVTANINTIQPVAVINPASSITCLSPTISITGGPLTGVTYTWNGGSIVGVNTNSTVNVNSAAIYSLNITSLSNGCTSAMPATVNIVSNLNTPTLSASNQTANLICGATSVSLSANINPSNSTYTWSSQGGGFLSGVNSSTVSVTTATNYVITATEPVSGCTNALTFTVIPDVNSPSVTLSSSTGTVTCNTSIISTTASSNPSSGVTYLWSGPGIVGSNNLATISGSLSGTYNLTVTNTNNNCTSAVAFVVSANNSTISPNLALTNTVNCSSSTATIFATPTPTSSLFLYNWSSGASTSSIIVSPNTNTTYSLTVTNPVNGCIGNTVITVSANTSQPVLVLSGVSQTISCSNPTVTISPSVSPSSNLVYSWTGPGIISPLNNTSIQVNLSGNYSLSVTNTLTGCSNSSITIPVVGTSVPPTLTVTSTSSIGIGCQLNTSTITLTALTPNSVTYSWSTGASSSNISTSIPGNYAVTIMDNASGCLTTKTINVVNNTTLPSFTASASGELPCGTIGSTTLNAIASITNVSYLWNGPQINSGANTASPIVSAPGIYTVVVWNNITGCSLTKTVAVNSTSVLAQFVPNITSGFVPLTVNFNNQSTGASTYSWSFGNGTSTETNPTNTFSNVGTYTVILYAMNGFCSDTAHAVIEVKYNVEFVPEVFTPNGDGKNDFLNILGLDSYPNNSFQVFNRWGNEVYYAKPYKNDWDGSPNKGASGSGKLPIGTYFYILDLGTQDKPIYRGFIELIY